MKAETARRICVYTENWKSNSNAGFLPMQVDEPMTTLTPHTASPLPTSPSGTNIATCAFGHRSHCGTCAGCQQIQALRQAAQLTAAIMANARWNARLH
jgi:hypothetical protein